MSRFTNTLGRVRVAAPCEADWDEMRGDERVRFCSRCSLNVYNLSAMTRREAERVVLGAEGRLCVRFYRRRDGTMLTQNCPTGLTKLKRRVSRVASATAAAALGLFTGVAATPESDEVRHYERSVAVTLPEPVVSDGPVANGRIDIAALRDETAVGAEASRDEAYEAEAFTMAEGAMTFDPVAAFAPFVLIGALFTLLTWPLLLLGCGYEESDGEKLRIWSNEWSSSDEHAALPCDAGAVGSESMNAPAPGSTLPLEV
jgi:hypothetical protein